MKDKKFKMKNVFTPSERMKFIIPSIIGLLLFVIPLPWGGTEWTIGVGYFATIFKSSFGEMLPAFMAYVVMLSAVLTLMGTLLNPKIVMDNEFLRGLFHVKSSTLMLWILSGVFAFVVLNKVGGFGFSMLSDPNTGGVVLNDLFPVLATWFFFSGLFLPLLMEFGSMDYFGTLIQRFMRPLFKVPGRSAIDAVASWIGSGPVGVVITDKQYREGYYTEKEASIISVCFSLVSLPFAVFIADFLNLSVSFLAFYGAISIASLIAALILPRIYPLNRKKDTYKEGVEVRINEVVPEGNTLHNWALANGVKKAKSAPGSKGLLLSGLKTVADVYFSLMPIVLFLGTLSLVIAEYTSFFSIISTVLIPVYGLLRVPDAAVAASATVVGFADMFLPAIFVKNSPFEMTRFIIGALSFTQLIYMTETGAVILRAKIPVNFKDLLIIFVERTLITLPIIVLIAHIVY